MPIIQKQNRQLILFLILIVFIIATLSVAIYTITAGNTIGTDILVFYLAGRSSFIDGQGPYIANNFVLSQIMVYGHTAGAGEDPLIFGYPPYILFPLIPLFFISFEWTQAIWLALLLIAVILTPLLFFPDSPRWLPATIILLYPISFGLLMGNFAIPIGIIILAVYGCLFNIKKASALLDFIAGVALAWSTAKPQFVWLFLIYFLIVSIKFKRYRLIYGFLTALFGFLVFSFIVSPTWIVDWWLQIQNYHFSIQTDLHLIQILGFISNENLTLFITAIISIGLIGWIIRLFYQWTKGENDALKVLCWIGLTTHLLYPGGVAYEQIVFMVPFIIWIMTNGRKHSGMSLLIWIIAILLSWLELTIHRLFPGVSIMNDWLFGFYFLWMLLIVEGGFNRLRAQFMNKRSSS